MANFYRPVSAIDMLAPNVMAGVNSKPIAERHWLLTAHAAKIPMLQ